MMYGNFKGAYPRLHSIFRLLTEEAMERANLEFYKHAAKACNNRALAKLIYHDDSAIFLSFVKDKKATLIARVRSSGNKQLKKELNAIRNAELGKKPFPGKPPKIKGESDSLMREYAEIILEFQKLRQQHMNIMKEKLFDKLDPDFHKEIKEIYKKHYSQEAADADFVINEEEIIDDIEQTLNDAMLNPFEITEQILAKKYGVEPETIGKKLPKSFTKRLRSCYPNLDKSFVDAIIDQITASKIQKKNWLYPKFPKHK